MHGYRTRTRSSLARGNLTSVTGMMVIALVATPGLAEVQQPLAVLIQLTGTATVVHQSGQRTQAHAPLRLSAGQWLILQRGSGGVLFYRDRPTETIPTAPYHRLIPIEPAANQRPNSSLARFWAFLLRKLFGGNETSMATTAAHFNGKAASGIHPLRPANSKELRRPLVLSWSARMPGAWYTVAIYDDGKQRWRSERVDATRLQYPVDAPELLPGRRYEWEVDAERAGQRVVSRRVWFELLDEAETKRVSAELAELNHKTGAPADPVARHIARAALLAAECLMAEAALDADEARRLRPNDEGLRRTLARLIEPDP